MMIKNSFSFSFSVLATLAFQDWGSVSQHAFAFSPSHVPTARKVQAPFSYVPKETATLVPHARGFSNSFKEMASIDLVSLLDDKPATATWGQNGTDAAVGDPNWLRALSRMPAGIVWTVPLGLAATLTYTGFFQRRLGFRFHSNVGGKEYSFSFTTTIDGNENDDAFFLSSSPTKKGRKSRDVSAQNTAFYVMVPPDDTLPFIDLSIIGFTQGDDVMVTGLVSEEPGIEEESAAGTVRDFPSQSSHITHPTNLKVASMLTKPDLKEHKEHCASNMVEGTPSTEQLTKEINTALDKGSMHIQQVKDFETVKGEFNDRERIEAAHRIQQAGTYLTEFTRRLLNNLVILKKQGELTINGEKLTKEDVMENAYAKVGFPTFSDYVNMLPIGFLSVITTSSFSKTIRETEVKTQLIESVVQSLGIVNNPVFEVEVVTRLAATLDNLLQIVKENRKENIETRLFTVTPLTEVRNGETIVTIKLTEFIMLASTWVDVFDGCNTKVSKKGANLSYKTREVSLEVVNKLLDSASEVVLDRLTNAISAYDNSDIPDEIDIDAL
mmetsp:Transcript_29138/g.79989  ORF Transcript_29138/g.79989 Transcript_29138/m.79989 type:complete len:553 (+) Transcript_29138:320-1978(+)